jgi:hypothetical protein
MLAFAFYVHYIRVAALASLMTRELDGVGGYFTNGGAAIVPVLAKALGDNEVAHHQKHQECEDKEPRKTEKMSSILQRTHPDPLP